MSYSEILRIIIEPHFLRTVEGEKGKKVLHGLSYTQKYFFILPKIRFEVLLNLSIALTTESERYPCYLSASTNRIV